MGGPDPSPRRSPGFLIALALGYAGAVIAYLPLLSFLLPMHIETLAPDARIGLLTASVIGGALAASVANIVFGALSDRSVARGRGRRGWVAGGIVGTAASYAAIAAATTPLSIVVGVILFQIGVNAVLAPLLAILADEVPDGQKGVAGALLSFGAPIASAVAALVVALPDASSGVRYLVVGAAMAAFIAPLLATRSRIVAPERVARIAWGRRDLMIAWGARLAVQVGGNAVSLYLLYYFQSVAPGTPLRETGVRVGHLLTWSLLASIPLALLAGRVSDRSGRRVPLLVVTALLAAAGLLYMATARDLFIAGIGFTLYSTASAVFLALHSGFAMLLLPSARHRGRDLGFVNLTNTLPALGGPLLAWALATPHDFGAVMLALAGLTALGGFMVLAIGRAAPV